MNQTTKTIIYVIIALVIIYVGYSLLKSESVEEGPIKIGFMAPLSGDVASFGEGAKRGLDLAKEDSGLENIEIIYEDSKAESPTAVSAITKLITIDGIVAVVGPMASGATLPSAPIANENKIVLITPSASSPELSSAGEYIFRTVASDAILGKLGAKMVKNAGHKKLAFLYSNEDYGVGFEKVAKETFIELGGEVVISESFIRGETDLRTQITKVKSETPDAIFLITNSIDSAIAFFVQAKELGIEVPVFTVDIVKSQEFIDGAQEAAEGAMILAVNPGTREFVQKHLETYNENPGPFSAQAYDAFTAIAKAIESGAKTGEEIKNALMDIEFDGASGHIKFDENGDVEGDYAVYLIKDNEFILIE